MVDMAHIAGLVAAGLHQSPIPYADFVTSTTHKTLRGPRSGFIICKQEFAKKIDKAVMPGIQGGPFMNVIAAKALIFKLAQTAKFKEYQQQVIKNAKAMSDELKRLGYRIISGTTDNHMFLVDLTSKKTTGKAAQDTLEKVGILVNKNSIPFDKKSPQITSGIRIGTPCITTRKMKKPESIRIAGLICKALENVDSESELEKIGRGVKNLCSEFLVY